MDPFKATIIVTATLASQMSNADSFAWTNIRDFQIKASSLHAPSEIETVIHDTPASPALSGNSTHLFYSDNETIFRSNFDGSSSIPFISSNRGTVYEIEATDEYIFWAQGSATSNSFYYANIDGTDPQLMDISTVFRPSYGFGAVGSKIYFPFFHQIRAYDVESDILSIIVSDLPDDPSTIEANSENLYWSYFGPPLYTQIASANIDGSNVNELVTVTGSISDIAIGQNSLYWINSGLGIGAVNFDGSNAQYILPESSLARITVIPETKTISFLTGVIICLALRRPNKAR